MTFLHSRSAKTSLRVINVIAGSVEFPCVFSIQTGNGGFEAFISADGCLHVAVLILNSGYTVFKVPLLKFADGKWVSL